MFGPFESQTCPVIRWLLYLVYYMCKIAKNGQLIPLCDVIWGSGKNCPKRWRKIPLTWNWVGKKLCWFNPATADGSEEVKTIGLNNWTDGSASNTGGAAFWKVKTKISWALFLRKIVHHVYSIPVLKKGIHTYYRHLCRKLHSFLLLGLKMNHFTELFCVQRDE